MASKVSIPSSENPIRMQSSLGGNVTYRETDSTIENYGIYLAYVTAVYYQKGTLDFKTRTTTEALVNSGIQDGTGHAPIPVETFGTNENGYVYGNYRPIAVGDKIAIAYVEGNMKTPIVIGVYPKDSASYELLSPTSFNVPQDNSEITNDQLYSSKVIYPSQQVLYQSGSGDILKSLGGKSFLSIAKDDTNYTKSINYAYDAIMAFYEGANQLNPKQEKAQAWLLVHEDNPDATSYDGHRTRFYVAPDGSIQVVLLNTQEDSQGILILEGSLDTGLTIKKQYDTNITTGATNSDEYVSFNIGGTNPFTLTASGLVEGEVKKTDLVLKPDNLYINDKAISTFVGKDYDDDIAKLQADYTALSKKLALVQDTANSASHGSSTAQQNSENANGKANDSNDENTWTPFKKAMLKQQIKILESEANSAIAYAEAVGMGHQDISDALKVLLNGTAALLTDMGKTETFSNATIQGWIVALKNAIDTFQKDANSDLHKQIATTADGKNSISKGTEPPDNPIVGDIWFQANADGTTNIKYYDNDGWYSPVYANVKAVEKEVSKIPQGYYQADEPQGDFKPNDIWYKVSTDSTTNQLVYTPYIRNADNTAWIPQRDTNSTQAVVGSQPASPIEGDFWTDTDNTLHQYKNGAWTVVPTQGPQGVAGTSSYVHIAYSNSADGKDDFSTTHFDNASYIGVLTDNKIDDSTTYTDYTWSKLKGTDGTNGKDGVEGPKGADGKTTYVHFAYANSADGATNFSVTYFDNALYIGNYTDFTEADSTTYTDYTWSRLRGVDGNDGENGLAGKDGVGIDNTTVSYQLWDSGTDEPTGTWSDSVPTLTKGKYLWTRTIWSYTDNTSETGYSVTYIAQDGNDGTNGVAGKDGTGIKSTAVTYQLSTSGTTTPTGTWVTTVPTLVKGQYLWTRTIWSYTDNSSETGYSVAYIGQDGANGKDGRDGDKGDTGATGADGATLYTWIKYATDSSGSNMSDSPTNMTYIGIAYNKTTSSESSTATDYKWSLIKGDQGIQGKTGADGKTSYFHIAYANSSDGSIGFTTSPSASASYNYMGTYSDYTSTSSTSYSSYKWVAMFDSSKKRNFTTQPTTPYAVGDTWTQSGATYFCKTARNSGAFTASDWTMQQLTIQALDSSVINNLYNDNLLTGTADKILTGSYTDDYLSNETTDDFLSLLQGLEGETVTVSVDYEYSGFAAGSSQNRLGWEIRVVADSTVYFGSWCYPNNGSGSGRISSTFVVPKNITVISYSNGYIQFSGSGTGTLSHLKLETGSVATPWCLSQSEITTTTGNYKGVTLNDAGLTATAGSTTVAMNSSDGFLIQKGATQLLHADTDGNLTMAGNITAGDISGVNFIGDNLSLAGSLKVTGSILSGNGKVALSNTGVTIKGAGFNLGDSSGNTTVSMKDDGTFLANKAVLSGSLTSNAVTITGGDINMNGGKFHVDTQGNVTATSFTATSLLDKGTIDFTNMTVDGLSANYIQTGILKGITLQGNTIIAGDGTITTQLDNNGFSQKSNDQFYNQVFNSEFLCSGQNWSMHTGVYVTNIAPTKDYSNRVAINPGTFTLEAGKWSNICDSLSIPINPNGKYSFSSIVGIFNDTPSNYDTILATLVWQDDNKKDLGHSDIYYDVNSRELQYLKKENVTPIAGATHVMFRWYVHAPASATGSGHIVFTQPYVTPYATCGVYRPGNVSSNNQINIKDGYIEFPIPDTYRSPSIVENASGYAGYDIVATGRGFLSAEGMFINAQVHKKDASDIVGTNIYTESMSLSPTGMTLSIINNYKNSNNLVATVDPTRGIATEFWQDNQVTKGSALQIGLLNLNGATIVNTDGTKHTLDIYNTTGTHFALGNDDRPYCLSEHISSRTYSNSSNVYVSESGALGRATSASKYKLAISDLYQASDKAHMFLAVKPKQWFDKEETDEFANDISGVGNYIDVPSVNTYAGFIAEDLEAAGLEEFVQRGIDGSLEGIAYDRLPVLHHQLLREAYNRIDYLETQLYLLKKKVDNL